VFGTRNGTRVTNRNFQRDFRAICQKLHITGVRCSPHTLRHTFAVLPARWWQPFYLSKILGHTSIKLRSGVCRAWRLRFAGGAQWAEPFAKMTNRASKSAVSASCRCSGGALSGASRIVCSKRCMVGYYCVEMTLSKDSRSKNLEEALLILMDDLDGQTFLGSFIDERSIDERILPTTWEELKRCHLVRQTNSRWSYTLSGPGWIAGLKLLGQFDTEEMRTNTGKLCAALKAKVKERKSEAMAHVSEIASAAGLSETFVRDAIESNLIEELFGTRGAEWSDRGTFVRIPVGFGH